MKSVSNCTTIAGGEEAQRGILRDYVTPGAYSQTPGIITITLVAANNFELKPALISMVQQSQFVGSATKDPNLHLSVFLEVCDTLKINGAFVVLFAYAYSRSHLGTKQGRGYIRYLWGQSRCGMSSPKSSFAQFFPPSKTASLWNWITSFAQGEDESLYEAWERFKDLLRLCPHHCLQKWMVV